MMPLTRLIILASLILPTLAACGGSGGANGSGTSAGSGGLVGGSGASGGSTGSGGLSGASFGGTANAGSGNVAGGPDGCVQVGTTCASNTQCCSGFCDPIANVCSKGAA